MNVTEQVNPTKKSDGVSVGGGKKVGFVWPKSGVFRVVCLTIRTQNVKLYNKLGDTNWRHNAINKKQKVALELFEQPKL